MGKVVLVVAVDDSDERARGTLCDQLKKVVQPHQIVQ